MIVINLSILITYNILAYRLQMWTTARTKRETFKETINADFYAYKLGF